MQHVNNVLLNKIEEKNNDLNKCKDLLTSSCAKVDAVNSAKTNTPKLPGISRLENFYKHCHTHGRIGNPLHASATHANPKEGYEKSAIIFNRKGGGVIKDIATPDS